MSTYDYAHPGHAAFTSVPHGVAVYERPLAPRLHAHLGVFLVTVLASLTGLAFYAVYASPWG